VSALAAAAAPAAVLQHSATSGLQAVCACTTLTTTARSYLTTAASRKAAQGSDIPEQGGSYYWVPPDQGQTFTPDRKSIHERRATGEDLPAVTNAFGASDSRQQPHHIGCIPNAVFNKCICCRSLGNISSCHSHVTLAVSHQCYCSTPSATTLALLCLDVPHRQARVSPGVSVTG
jgi:hypothetical protein